MQVFASKEKIGTLTNLGSAVQLGPSVLKIGGLQFITTSNIQVSYPSLTANTLYMIYAIVVAGSPQLVISQNVNSVGPTGIDTWKLVGAFYSDGVGSISFGSFINIEGKPESGWFSIDPVWQNITLGTGFSTSALLKINGDSIDVKGNLQLGTGAGATSIMGMVIPTNQVVDTNRILASGNNDEPLGVAELVDSSPITFYESIAEFTAARGQVEFTNAFVGSPFTWAVNDRIAFKINLPVTTSSNTPIEDR